MGLGAAPFRAEDASRPDRSLLARRSGLRAFRSRGDLLVRLGTRNPGTKKGCARSVRSSCSRRAGLRAPSAAITRHSGTSVKGGGDACAYCARDHPQCRPRSEGSNGQVVPQVSGAPGFKTGYWTWSTGGGELNGLSMIIFDSEDNARAAGDRVSAIASAAPDNVTLDGVEVREVVASA